MRKLLSALIVTMGVGGTASAETYLGAGLGTAADTSAGNATNGATAMAQGNGRSGRLMLGLRFGRLSIEGAASRYGLFFDNQPADNTQFSAALKYSIPLSDGFELFGRGGLERGSLSTSNGMSQYDASGDGYLLGAGVALRLDALIGGGSVFVDYERSSTTFTNSTGTKFDMTAGMWTAGLTLSL